MRIRVAGTCVLALTSVVFAGVPAVAAPGAVLLADTSRNGTVDWADQAGKNRWTPQRGAIFLPNLDDDARRCEVTEEDLKDRAIAVDERLAACNDAQDEVVNGPRDAADFAPLRTMPRAVSQDGTVSLGAGEGRYARLWVERGGAWTALGDSGTLTAAELRAGARLALEGRDVIRDRAVWNGTVTVTLKAGGTDSVQLRVAPLVLQNDLKAPKQVVTSKPTRPEWSAGYDVFVAGLRGAMTAAGLPESALTAISNDDRWFQDIFEPTTAGMPGPGGTTQVMHVLLRSANYRAGTETAPPALRQAGRVAFSALRGPDVGVVQQFTDQRSPAVDDSLNSTGNYESLPPHRGHGLGRPLYGSTPERMPDPTFTTLIGSQYADPVVIDTSWLIVGHSDETVHAIPARNSRGWTLMVADPRLALDVLRQAARDGHGAAVLFEGTSATEKPTVDQALADAAFLERNEKAARHIDTQLAVLTAETGLAGHELVRVPVLFEEFTWRQLDAATDRLTASGQLTREMVADLRDRMKAGAAPESLMVAQSAGIPNGISLGGGVFGAPDPHGPKAGGVDLFKRTTEQALAGTPVEVRWIEDWDFLHMGAGEVHCGTNTLRDPARADWWRA
ncbi:protein-arginine deiminase [Lentzea xinjiangensis]|uniref:Protein-arginine deiminase n=1 Tax=Lentzea xinjiangensis TaxID=402600 RepID=A0A1H9VJK6_9PSEU|nr:protein-arginine deiminase family protein [Lentzea xinjiangensis]SES21383.1 protein-arginine deiminase [Lentzea xinjiangensis]